MEAVEDGDEDTVQALIAAGADVNAVNDDGETALGLAKENYEDEMVKMIREAKGAKPGQGDQGAKTERGAKAEGGAEAEQGAKGEQADPSVQ